MKKGCFISAIVILTIIVAVILYIFQYHLDDFIINPGRKLIAEFIRDELESKMEFVKNSPEKMELKNLLKDVSENTELLKQFTKEEVNKITTLIESAIADSIIERDELENIKQIIKSKIK